MLFVALPHAAHQKEKNINIARWADLRPLAPRADQKAVRGLRRRSEIMAIEAGAHSRLFGRAVLERRRRDGEIRQERTEAASHIVPSGGLRRWRTKKQ